MMTSVDPRAFMPQAECKTLAPRQATEFGANESAAELADAGDQDEAAGQQGDLRVREDGEICAQAGNAKEHRREERRNDAAQLFVDMLGEDRRLADQDAGDEGAEHGMHADQHR